MPKAHHQYQVLLGELTSCETRVWDALVLGDQSADRAALDESFLGVYSDGFAGKDEHVQQLANGPTVQAYELSDLRIIQLGNEHAVLSYRADFRRRSQTAPETMYVSSIWRRRGDNWVNIFSQDTPAKE